MSQSIIDDKDQQRTAIFNQEDSSPADLWAEILNSDDILVFSKGEFRNSSVVIVKDDSFGGSSAFSVLAEGQILSFSSDSGYDWRY